MNDEIILRKAIEKAMNQGYHPEMLWQFKEDYKKPDLDGYYKWLVDKKLYRVLIFSHDFAKAFFKKSLLGWKWHLQQMVLEKEPLLYLKRFL